MVKDLCPARFDPQTRQWRPDDAGVAPASACLKLATYNVWFDAYACEVRREALLTILAACEADVIALQEVTPPLLERILTTDWIRAHYAISDCKGETVFPYGTLLLMRWTPARLLLHELPTKLWRKLLLAEFDLNATRTAIATVHLESMPSSEAMRGVQLREIFRILSPAAHAVLMGDFNFCSSWQQENARIDPAYSDLWSVLRPDEAGHTEDTAINAMLRRKEGGSRQVRFDRILLRAADAAWVPESIRLLGDSPVAPATPEVFPSDHFGLLATLRWLGQAPGEN